MALGIGMGLGLDHALAGGGGGSAFEWTDHVPHADTVKFYVSDSDGNDANDGLSPASPKKTIAAAADLVVARGLKPDWILLKRGDSFSERLGWFVESIGGYSAEYPMIFGAYGTDTDPRPEIHPPDLAANFNHVSHIALMSLDVFCPTHAAGNNFDGIICHSTTDVLLEDVRFRDLKSAIVCQNTFGAGRPNGFRVRRCSAYDIYLTTTGGIGVYFEEADGVEFEETMIDYCGWHAGTAAPGGFFHNTYFQHNCGPIVFKRCISTRSSLDGLNCRSGGWIEDNLIAGSPIGIGYSSGTAGYNWAANRGSVKRNVFLEPWESFGGLYWGFAFQTAHYFDANENIAYGNTLPLNDDFSFDFSGTAGPYGAAGVTHATITGNIAYQCRAPFRVRNNTGSDLSDLVVTGNDVQEDVGFNASNGWGDPVCLGMQHQNAYPGTVTFGGNSWFTGRAAGQWFSDGFGGLSSFAGYMATIGDTTSTNSAKSYSAPARSFADYMASIGETGGLVEFCAGARENRRYAWDDDYTAVAIINYIRDGFDLAPIA